MTRFLTAVIVDNNDFAVARQHQTVSFRIDNDVTVFKLHNTGKRNFDRSLLGTFLRRTADMEGSHGQLRTRLTDRLRGNNAYRLSDVNRRASGQIAAIAGSANAVFGFAGQNRTDFNLFDTGCFNNLNVVFVNQFTFLDQNFAGFRMQNIFLNGPAQNTLAD